MWVAGVQTLVLSFAAFQSLQQEVGLEAQCQVLNWAPDKECQPLHSSYYAILVTQYDTCTSGDLDIRGESWSPSHSDAE